MNTEKIKEAQRLIIECATIVEGLSHPGKLRQKLADAHDLLEGELDAAAGIAETEQPRSAQEAGIMHMERVIAGDRLINAGWIENRDGGTWIDPKTGIVHSFIDARAILFNRGNDDDGDRPETIREWTGAEL